MKPRLLSPHRQSSPRSPSARSSRYRSGPSTAVRAAAGVRRGPLENNRIRLTQLSVEPGATLPAGGNQVLVYLTADPDGRIPAEAVWQAAGAGAVQNRGPARLNAISIELKDVQGTSSGTPPEALDAQYGVEVTRLIDNPRVLVTKHRYGPIAYGGPLHFHGEDVLVVYLRGGYTWPLTDFWGATAVRRGDVERHPGKHVPPHRQCRQRPTRTARHGTGRPRP